LLVGTDLYQIFIVEKGQHEKKEEEEEKEGRGVGGEENIKKLVMMIKAEKVVM
jgi:hypothetical protein